MACRSNMCMQPQPSIRKVAAHSTKAIVGEDQQAKITKSDESCFLNFKERISKYSKHAWDISTLSMHHHKNH